MTAMTNKTDWPDEIYRTLREWDVTQFAYVPDAGHKVLINLSLKDPHVHSVPLTTEEEGVAMLVGAHLGWARGVVLMQSSGVGNCVNMFSYVKNGQYPMLILVSMRGEFGERNPWQYAAGQAVQPIFETCGLICLKIEKPEEVAETMQAACAMVFKAGKAVAVILSQRLIGAKMM
jgi:sulfopyruvate decarboxylase TPP-binding subunit